jgi:acyl-CoA synthetase (AMP-forming)/AMP-acid ligase II
MQTSSPETIRHYTELGWWGSTTTTDLFAQVVAAHPDRRALVDPPNRETFAEGAARSLSYSQLASEVERLAALLFDHGIRQDDIVVVQMPNITDLVALYLALAQIGAIISPVPMQYGLHELRKIASETSARAFVSVARIKGAPHLQGQRQAFADNCLFAAFGQSADDTLDLLAANPDAQQRKAWSDYRQQLRIDANDIFTICWTSGTTGQPKGVPRSHNHWLSQSIATFDGMGLEDGDAMLNPFPLVNMASFGGFFYPWLLSAGTLVLHQPMDLQVFLGQLQQEKIAYSIAAPAVLNMLLQKKEILDQVDLSNLRVIASGSAPLSPWMVAEFHNSYGISVVNIFGSNEGAALISSSADIPDPHKRAAYFPRFGVPGLQWSNRVAERIQTRLVDLESGKPIEQPGQSGELQISGPNVFDGYYRSESSRQDVFTDDGFFKTGDLFEIAGSGEDARFYHFTGRCKDIIIRGGMKISPEELDILLAGHPRVAEAAVVSYPDEIMGERIAAVVAPKAGETITLEDITDYLKEQGLAVIKLPERLQIVEALPRNPVGKVVRTQLTELLE